MTMLTRKVLYFPFCPLIFMNYLCPTRYLHWCFANSLQENGICNRFSVANSLQKVFCDRKVSQTLLIIRVILWLSLKCCY
ncbi:hypothetical protein HanRHA438_Chr05g0227591 [Helianthus annuus]|nr:hypothetical protein HanIR_Chr05g0234831 [Helianthus annuus]KAJ0919261.1 hypothetical protein HanRHA438_Chr05g0227591 [Helianthus annuus]